MGWGPKLIDYINYIRFPFQKGVQPEEYRFLFNTQLSELDCFIYKIANSNQP